MVTFDSVRRLAITRLMLVVSMSWKPPSGDTVMDGGTLVTGELVGVEGVVGVDFWGEGGT